MHYVFYQLTSATVSLGTVIGQEGNDSTFPSIPPPLMRLDTTHSYLHHQTTLQYTSTTPSLSQLVSIVIILMIYH